jgi:hypothetical protein
MLRPKMPRLLVVAAFAVAALGATPLAEAGIADGPSAQAAAPAWPPGPTVAAYPPGPSADGIIAIL